MMPKKRRTRLSGVTARFTSTSMPAIAKAAIVRTAETIDRGVPAVVSGRTADRGAHLEFDRFRLKQSRSDFPGPRGLFTSEVGSTPNDRAVDAARGLNRAAGTLAASVLADSAIEHYRGSFENRMMYLPLITSALSVVASGFGAIDRRTIGHPARDPIHLLAAATGVTGTGFHIYNIAKREGGFSWINLFYAAPVGAPAALALSGLFGVFAERLRQNPRAKAPRLCGLPAGRAIAAITGVGLAGTVGEAGLMHFRGSFHDPFMVLPVAAPPVAAALMGAVAVLPENTAPLRRVTRWWLRATAVLGFAGVGFHVYGVSRGMGGWRNWSQNVLNGPPIPAPPSFTGLAMAGLAALALLGNHSGVETNE